MWLVFLLHSLSKVVAVILSEYGRVELYQKFCPSVVFPGSVFFPCWKLLSRAEFPNRKNCTSVVFPGWETCPGKNCPSDKKIIAKVQFFPHAVFPGRKDCTSVVFPHGKIALV